MKNEFFDQKFFNNFDAPMKKLMELNVKMMQNLSLMKPMDLSSIKRPEDYFEKNIELFMQNSHMTLNYMRDMFNILESHWLNVSRNLDQNTKKMMSEVSATMEQSTKKASAAAKSTAKKVSSSVKKASSPAKKGAPTAQKASSPVNKVSEKKNTKITSKTTSSLKTKQEAKSTTPKSTVIPKEPMAQNATKGNIIAEKNMPKLNNLTEKSNPNIQNLGKSNPITNQ
ncbi:hypothetical protein DGG96_19050 [Legionella qingyii]|uniref:Phasin domain-containing protein n=1 Tax=Legionella qingyii TaxID=2184757 RepID=A0A317TX82_9GAMM|nr:hypothetical protein [Legionella qingyii]PWY54054.1 hypothetical protein DGG96_19050 [Legionella qingyii]RUR19151.1 hypothetical protein ELY20_16055 [Legionella qingyii]RUR22893.1 hypothetical protein ELY16_14115 [Legionella qingyii]